MKVLGLIFGVAFAVLTAAFAAPVSVAGDQITLNGSFGVGTDYVFRGLSMVHSGPAASANVEFGYRGFYAGVLANRVDLDRRRDNTSAQLDFSAGWRAPFMGGVVDLGVVEHVFTRQPHAMHHWKHTDGLDFWEARLAGARTFALTPTPNEPFGSLTLHTSTSWTPDYAGRAEGALYTEGSVIVPVWHKVFASAGGGRQFFFDGFERRDYSTWNAGVTAELYPGLALDARYIGTDAESHHHWRYLGDPVNDGQAVAALTYAY